MKKIIVSVVAVALVFSVFVSPGQTKVKSYYSGDAIVFNGQTVVGSTNSDALEIFVLGADGLNKTTSLRPYDGRFNKYDTFYDFKFNEENGRLYVYAVSGFSLYKYDLNNLSEASLVKKVTGTSWEWYNRVDKFGDNIVTISSKGVKIWSHDMDTVDGYALTNETPYNIRSGGTDKYIFSAENNEIKVYDREQRAVVKNIQVDYKNALGNRATYYDIYDDAIYVVDDNSAKKFSVSTGALLAHFAHSGDLGYDIASSGNEYVYFSDGIGIVKLDKENMQALDWKYTTGGEGNWAMGLKVVNNGGDNIVVFNGASIIVLDDNMRVLGQVDATDAPEELSATENLWLNLSAKSASTGADLEITGGGYFPKETLNLSFNSLKTTVVTDENGRFKSVVKVPEISGTNNSKVNLTAVTEEITNHTDIKVDGAKSLKTYSISFDIVNIVDKN